MAGCCICVAVVGCGDKVAVRMIQARPIGERQHPVFEVGVAEAHRRFWREWYETGAWEPCTRGVIGELLGPGDLFVDIGAWIGPVTLWALEQGAKVVAVEPDPAALPELRRRVPDSVEVWEGAVALQPGTVTLASRFGLGLGKSVSRVVPMGSERRMEIGDHAVTVRAWTLDEILDERIPNFVKMDIEGYETELLPEIAPHLAALSVPLQVALHGIHPDPEWFQGYGDVSIPDDPHGTVVAKP